MTAVCKNLLNLLCVALTAMPCLAAPLTEAQQQDALTKINRATSQIKTMQCVITQTKHLSLLSEDMTAKGIMVYRQPNELRWEYTSPYEYLFIFNGEQVYVGNKTRQDVVGTGSNKVYKEVARLMMATVTGTALANSSEFAIDVDASDAAWLVTLTPKKKEIKRMFRKFVLSFSKSACMIAEVAIYETNGDCTNIHFDTITTNKPVDDTNFAIP